MFLKHLSQFDYTNSLITIEALFFLHNKIKIKKINSIINVQNYFSSKNWKIITNNYIFFKLICKYIRLSLISKIHKFEINKKYHNLCFKLLLLQLTSFQYVKIISYIYYNFKKIMLNNFLKKIKIFFKKFYKININNKDYDLFLFQAVLDFLKFKNDSLITNKPIIEIKKFKPHNLFFIKYSIFLKRKKNYKILISKLKIYDLFNFYFESHYLTLLKIMRVKLKRMHLWFTKSYFFYCDNQNELFRANLCRKKNFYLNILTELKKKWLIYSVEYISASHEILDITFELKNYNEFHFKKKSKILFNWFFFNKFKIFILEIDKFQSKNFFFLNHKNKFLCEKSYLINVKNLTKHSNNFNFIGQNLIISKKNTFLNRNAKIELLKFKFFICVFLDSIFLKLIKLKIFYIFYNHENYPNSLFIKENEYLFEIANLTKFACVNYFFYDYQINNLDGNCLKLDKFWYIYGYKMCLILDKLSFTCYFGGEKENFFFINSSNINEYKTIIYFKRFLPLCEYFLSCYISFFYSFDLFKYITNEKIYQIKCILKKIIENLHQNIYYLTILLFSQFFIALGQIGKARVVFITGVLFSINKKKYESDIFSNFFFFFEIIYGTFFSFRNLHKIKKYISLVHRISFFEYSFFLDN